MERETEAPDVAAAPQRPGFSPSSSAKIEGLGSSTYHHGGLADGAMDKGRPAWGEPAVAADQLYAPRATAETEASRAGEPVVEATPDVAPTGFFGSMGNALSRAVELAGDVMDGVANVFEGLFASSSAQSQAPAAEASPERTSKEQVNEQVRSEMSLLQKEIDAGTANEQPFPRHESFNERPRNVPTNDKDGGRGD